MTTATTTTAPYRNGGPTAKAVAKRAAAAAAFTSPIVTTLERVWAGIARRHPELPARVAITLGSGTEGKVAKWGHFASGRWTADQAEVHEVFVAGELLALQDPRRVLGTLLHEAAHTLAHVREVQDTSRGGRYHNTRYRAVATELGLDVATVGTIGWSATSVTDATAEVYAAELAELAKVAASRSGEYRTTRPSNNNGVVWECGCRKIRLSKSAAGLGGITCQACGLDFTGPDADDDDADDDE